MRVYQGSGRHARRSRLQRLGPPDLAAIRMHVHDRRLVPCAEQRVALAHRLAQPRPDRQHQIGVATGLVGILKAFGATLLLLTLFVASAPFALMFSWLELLDRVGHWTVETLRRLREGRQTEAHSALEEGLALMPETALPAGEPAARPEVIRQRVLQEVTDPLIVALREVGR